MWELDCEESWVPKNWCFWTEVLEKTLESPLDCKEIQPVHPKGDQSWVFIGGTDIEAETPVLWLPNAERWLIWKDPGAGRDWGQEEKGMTEDEMAGWHYRLDGHEFEWTPGVEDGQGGLACCSSWGRKELDTIERMNWTDMQILISQWILSLSLKRNGKILKTWHINSKYPSPKQNILYLDISFQFQTKWKKLIENPFLIECHVNFRIYVLL